jgi:hypothetical protein
VRAVAPGGEVAWRRQMPPRSRILTGAAAGDGPAAAIVRREPDGRQTALLLDAHGHSRVLLTDGRIGPLRFSPDGRWLLVAWPQRDSWLFFATAAADRRVMQVTGIRRRFGGTEATVRDWCCAPRRAVAGPSAPG